MSGVAIQFVRPALAAGGADVRRVLREVGVDAGASRVDCDRVVELVRSLWRLTGDELLGLGPRPVPLGTVRLIALAVVHAPDLRTALGRVVEFAALTTGYTRGRLVVDGGVCRVEFASDPDVVDEPLALEAVLAFAHRFAGWLVGRRIVLTGLAFPFAEPEHSAEYEDVFGVAAGFHAPAASLSFDAAHLTAPVVRDEAALEVFLREAPVDVIMLRDHGTTTADRVRRIVEQDPGGRVDAVAARLAFSAQHLRRLLRREGTSFQEIREDVLRGIAVAGLERGRESVDDLSRRLGFSEPSAFRRAFARWVGSPPGEYRARHALRSGGGAPRSRS
ncbi:AraC family transcriptional regulator [Umezawaea endophytica]|uniref:AraC family transcriptional regulator n=1 Tax=Umezawaea endophytica TaxID=1654476 RepID=A0A9X3AHJ0_9PSEU|nr:AraC family transcriptional regulator [Umezawaea endophytica]MCS7479475.1 AraC family transcriptional regulator [Umezawaea endophytica]